MMEHNELQPLVDYLFKEGVISNNKTLNKMDCIIVIFCALSLFYGVLHKISEINFERRKKRKCQLKKF